MFNLVSGSPEWRITAQAQTDAVRQVYLYDEISYYGVTAADMVGALAGAGDVELHIHSPGGDCFEGIAILNVLRAHPSPIDVVIDGVAASAASFVAMAGRTVTVARNAQMMIHDALMITVGNQADHLVSADLLGMASDNVASIYAARAGGTVAEWRARMRAETWFTADAAVTAGLADKVAGPAAAPENAWDLSVFTNSRPAAVAAGDPLPGEKPPIQVDVEAFRNAMKEVFA
jgi:ATP-dependent protease ClpP protease subunit